MWKTSSRRLKPDSCQKHQHKTDRLTSDSRQTQTPPAQPRLHFLLPESPPSELNFNFFRALVQSSVTDIGCYIRSRRITHDYTRCLSMTSAALDKFNNVHVIIREYVRIMEPWFKNGWNIAANPKHISYKDSGPRFFPLNYRQYNERIIDICICTRPERHPHTQVDWEHRSLFGK
jgi:hypothetical protein